MTVLHDVGTAPTPSLGNINASISTQAGGCDVDSGTEDPRMPVSRECALPIVCKTHTEETVNANLHSQPVLVIKTHNSQISRDRINKVTEQKNKREEINLWLAQVFLPNVFVEDLRLLHYMC